MLKLSTQFLKNYKFTKETFLISIIFLLPISSMLYAQNKVKRDSSKFKNEKNFEIGLSSGIALNNFTEAQPHTGINLGFIGGVSLNYYIYKSLSLQVEANYLQKGGQLITFKDDTRYGVPESFNSKNVKNSSYILHSLDLPLLLNYTFKIKQSWKPSLYAGGSFTNVAGVTERYEKTGGLLTGEDIIATTSGYQNVNEGFEKNHWNALVGTSVKLPFMKNNLLQLDFRYVFGLTSAKNNYSYMEKDGFGIDILANSFISKVGVIFPLK